MSILPHYTSWHYNGTPQVDAHEMNSLVASHLSHNKARPPKAANKYMSHDPACESNTFYPLAVQREGK